MSKLRRAIKKWLYGNCPGFAGSFPYWGTKVYFPKNSLIFDMACEQGTYESENLRLLCSLVEPNSVYFDVGANIGLMSIPILHSCPDCTVVSMEPSPKTLQFLIPTAESSGFGNRWRILGKAAGSSIGSLDFFTASVELGAYDGLRDTKRAGATSKVTVPVTTLDAEWNAMGQPPVSVIKIDVEGAEIEVFQGAISCIKHEQPYILTEWNSLNLSAYKCEPERLITLADNLGYQVFSLPYLLPVTNSAMLRLQMLKTENFLLAPDSARSTQTISNLPDHFFHPYQ
jgi:FkbM family methyltransferase